MYHLAPSSIVPSTEALRSTLKRQASKLTQIAEYVCGGFAGARVQLISWAQEAVSSCTGKLAAGGWS